MGSASGLLAPGSLFIPAFDGRNIWVPKEGLNTLTVVDTTGPRVVAVLGGNGLNVPSQAVFDGQFVLVLEAGFFSIWRAADLTPLGYFGNYNTSPILACSDGVRFWLVLAGNPQKIASF